MTVEPVGEFADALASSPLRWREKLLMDVSLWVRFTATKSCGQEKPLTEC